MPKTDFFFLSHQDPKQRSLLFEPYEYVNRDGGVEARLNVRIAYGDRTRGTCNMTREEARAMRDAFTRFLEEF